MAKVKAKKFVFDGKRDKNYVRAWKEGRQEIVVQVWLNKDTPEGEPEGDWAMPAVFGIMGCIEQAILQTK